MKLRTFFLTAFVWSCLLTVDAQTAGTRIPSAGEPFKVSIVGSNFIHFGADTTIQMIHRVGVHYLCIKNKHLPYSSSNEEIKKYLSKLKAADITPLSVGLIYMKKQKDVDQAFNYAQRVGVALIIGTPNHELLPYVEQKVKETGISLAIHTHGPDMPLYPDVKDVISHIDTLDHRIGVCMDIAHDARWGSDPLADLIQYKDRILDIHIKDVSERSKNGRPCEMGRGVLDLPAFVRALRNSGYDRTVTFELEKDLVAGPLVGIAETIGYFNGLLDATRIPVDVLSPHWIQSRMQTVVDWQIAHKKRRVKNEWTHGVLYAGMMDAWRATHYQPALDAVMEAGKECGWKPRERYYHADDYAIGQAYMDLYREKHNPAMMVHVKTTVDKFIAKTDEKHGKMRWSWCDALFMGAPVLTKVGATLHVAPYHKYTYKYFRECFNLLYDTNEHLFYRDSTFMDPTVKESNGKPVFWLRGNGWVMAGMAKILTDLPKKNKHRAFYEQTLREMSERMSELLPDDGMWRPGLLNQPVYPHGEISGTALVCYAMAWGINNGVLDRQQYLPVVTKVWEAINRCVSEDGRVGWVQQIGKDPRSNYKADSWELYGTGAYLMAGSEMMKLKK